MNYFTTLLGLSLGAYIFGGLLVLAIYIFNSLALYTIAKNNGMEKNAYFAWIPFLNLYFKAQVAGDFKLGDHEIKASVAGAAYIICSIATNVRGLGSVFIILTMLVGFFIDKALYSRLEGIDDPVLMAALSLIPIVYTVIIFIHRNDRMVINVDSNVVDSDVVDSDYRAEREEFRESKAENSDSNSGNSAGNS